MRPAFRSAIAGLAFLAGCGGDSITDPRPIVGTYTLQTVNGQTLPWLLSEFAEWRTEVTSGRISLDPNGMVHRELDIQNTRAGVPTDNGTLHMFGTYVRMGNRVAVNWNDGDSNRMTLSGSTLAEDVDGRTLVYTR